MSTSYIAEYLESLERPGGGRLVKPAISQVYVPAIPPLTSLSWYTAPRDGEYCAIGLKIILSTAMVPNALYGSGQQYGSRIVEGIITQTWLENPIEAIYFMSKAWPAYLRIVNLTNMVQLWESLQYYLIVASEQDLALVLDALRRLSTSSKLEQAAIQANNLLTNIWRQLGGRPK